MNKYKLVILFGKAGAGKDFLLNKIKEKYGDEINVIISDTTRPARSNEIPGRDYNFLTIEEFNSRDHIETSNFNSWMYGTPVNSLSKEKVNIGVMNLEGIHQLYFREDLQVVLFYISASDQTRILRQIGRELYPDISEICRRFLADEDDFKNLNHYSYTIIRNSGDYTVDQDIAVISERIDELQADLDRIN